METQSFLQTRTIIDVRTPEEFHDGHFDGAMNIPFSLLPLKLDELKAITNDITLCCASGARSRAAARLLHSNGINCTDVGPWYNLHDLQEQHELNVQGKGLIS